ncbi:UNVERIFIED_CONTAM: SNF1-related protein kinase regulatory subunit gamma-1 [Sesamum radiatum]|uniref:SNF1-related protein kinase regulatory subunit gamma-1 n=1 Tax=Sesamum radiatum TaxID=300843 RepID=A0AAW2VKJ0_SESRA
MNRLEMMTVAVEEGETPTSPGVKLGMQVEDLWDVQGSQLSPTEKLNACFESIPVSAFPPAPSSQGIVEFAGIVVWILHQSEKMEGDSFGPATNDFEDDAGPAVAAAASGMSPLRFKSMHPNSLSATCGNFF